VFRPIDGRRDSRHIARSARWRKRNGGHDVKLRRAGGHKPTTSLHGETPSCANRRHADDRVTSGRTRRRQTVAEGKFWPDEAFGKVVAVRWMGAIPPLQSLSSARTQHSWRAEEPMSTPTDRKKPVDRCESGKLPGRSCPDGSAGVWASQQACIAVGTGR
jgi:hypothetical protein